MGIDPLSAATRVAKRNLLAAALIGITYKAFDFTVEKIPVSVISIKFEKGAFVFLILCAILYFLITFSLYYFIDVRNIERTEHETKSDFVYQQALSLFQQRFISDVEAAVAEVLASSKARAEFKNLAVVFGLAPETNYVPPTFTLYGESAAYDPFGNGLDPTDHSNLYELVEAMLADFTKKYRREYRNVRLLALPRMVAVRSVYSVRNYLVDGAFPIALGVVSALAMLNVLSVRWLQYLTPLN
jgi:hypothetical protein